jgi:hypothetical protein
MHENTSEPVEWAKIQIPEHLAIRHGVPATRYIRVVRVEHEGEEVPGGLREQLHR